MADRMGPVATGMLPNILLVVIDCARSDVWLDDRPVPLTPNLNALRRDALTLPVCIAETSGTTPNFATLLSGLFSPRHGVRLILGQALGKEIPLLTEELADLGYHTCAEVTGPLIPDVGLGRGFEKYRYRAPCDYLDTAWGDRFADGLRRGEYKRPWFILLHLWEMHMPRRIDPSIKKTGAGRNDYELAVASLDSQLGRVFDAAGEDAFLIVTGDHGEKLLSEAYGPGTAVEYIWSYLGIDKARGPSLIRISSLTGPSTLHHLLAEFAEPLLEAAGREGRQPQASFSWPRRVADFFRVLRLMPRFRPADLLVLNAPLKLTAWMHERGLLDENRSREKALRFIRGRRPAALDAMLVRLMINSYRGHYEEGHILHVYDSLVKVPLVMRWKSRLPGGRTIARMVRQADILPSALDLIGAPMARCGELDGWSFKSLLNGEDWKPRPAFLSTGGYLSQVEIRGVRTESWKYTFGPFNDELPEELYDLRTDPAETKNMATEKSEICAGMRRLLATFSFPDESPRGSAVVATKGDQEMIERTLKDLGYLD
jgi:arylsulfatase A-like enzyme